MNDSRVIALFFTHRFDVPNSFSTKSYVVKFLQHSIFINNRPKSCVQLNIRLACERKCGGMVFEALIAPKSRAQPTILLAMEHDCSVSPSYPPSYHAFLHNSACILQTALLFSVDLKNVEQTRAILRTHALLAYKVVQALPELLSSKEKARCQLNTRNHTPSPRTSIRRTMVHKHNSKTGRP